MLPCVVVDNIYPSLDHPAARAYAWAVLKPIIVEGIVVTAVIVCAALLISLLTQQMPNVIRWTIDRSHKSLKRKR